MSDTATSAPPGVAPQVYDHIRALLRAGKNDEAIVKACAVAVIRPHDLIAKELLFDGFFQKRDWLPALALAQELVRRQPDVARLQKAVIATLSNLKRYDATIAQATEYIVRHGEDLTMLDALKVASFYTGKMEDAIRWGQRALELRDAEACANPPPVAMTEPSGPPQGTNVISFSLWGAVPFYCYGAMINLKLARAVYPGWACRFYVDAAVPRPCVAYLRDNGADVRAIEDEYPGVGLFQRFLVMNDRTVGRFLIRDCDARLSAAEADLVRQWIDSGYQFHVVRDHVLHNELMIGCLWAGRTDCGIDIVDLMRRYFTDGPTAKYGHDQRMLGRMLRAVPVPLTDPQSRFGAGHQNVPAVRAEAERLRIPRIL